MKKRIGSFTLRDEVLEGAEEYLINHFLDHVLRRYHINRGDTEFFFDSIGAGLSPSTKLIVRSDEIYPFFVKISSVANVQKEVGNYNRASYNLPPLYVPPLETVLSSSVKKYHSEISDGYALMAFRYVSGSSKGLAPKTLFDAFGEIDQYRMIELIDEIFQSVLSDLHGFSNKAESRLFEHYQHDASIFETVGNPTLSRMIGQYNKIASGAKRFNLPHGMLHGDFHCENIIVNKKFTPVIIDFEMLRLDGCIVNDYAEFEIALLTAALDSNVDCFGPHVRVCYQNSNILNFFGVDKFSRCARAIRSNLCHNVFNEFGMEASQENIDKVSYTYMCLLLRYLCSYSWVSLVSMEESRSLVVLGVLSQVFDQIIHMVESMETSLVQHRLIE